MPPPDELSEHDRTTKDRLDILTQAVRRLRGRQWRVVPHPGPIGGEQHVARGKSGALRAAIFGVNDGLVSNLSLIFGVSGASVDNSIVIVAGVAGLLAGAFSMAAGEYISVRVQREVYERLIHLEAHEIGSDPEAERLELAELYVRKGLPRDLSDRLATELMRDPEIALETHAREELGLDPQEGLGSPFAAAGSSFVTFALGAFVPLLPFLVSSGTPAIVASAILSGIALFGVGAAMSYLTGRPWLLSGSRMLAVGATAAGVTYLVGRALDVGVLS
jgi:vacuolar iron transporter family protein